MGASVAKRMGSYAAKPAKELDASAIHYSRVWEDHRLLSQGLHSQPGDIVLCITRWVNTSSHTLMKRRLSVTNFELGKQLVTDNLFIYVEAN